MAEVELEEYDRIESEFKYFTYHILSKEAELMCNLYQDNDSEDKKMCFIKEEYLSKKIKSTRAYNSFSCFIKLKMNKYLCRYYFNNKIIFDTDKFSILYLLTIYYDEDNKSMEQWYDSQFYFVIPNFMLRETNKDEVLIFDQKEINKMKNFNFRTKIFSNMYHFMYYEFKKSSLCSRERNYFTWKQDIEKYNFNNKYEEDEWL